MTLLTSAFAEFDRDRVIQACNKYLDDRKERINRKKESFIQKAMEPRKRFWGLITTQHSREEAEKLWKYGDGLEFSPEMRAYQYKEIETMKVYQLLNLARNSHGQTVFVDASLAFLFNSP